MVIEDNDKEPIGCGISWLWLTDKSDPFMDSCARHDKLYDMRREGMVVDKSSKRIDKLFLKDMLRASGNSKLLKTRAYLFYALARMWGYFRWPR